MSYTVFKSAYDQSINGYRYSARDLSKSLHFKQVAPGVWKNKAVISELPQTAVTLSNLTKEDAELVIQHLVRVDELQGLMSLRVGVTRPVLHAATISQAA